MKNALWNARVDKLRRHLSTYQCLNRLKNTYSYVPTGYASRSTSQFERDYAMRQRAKEADKDAWLSWAFSTIEHVFEMNIGKGYADILNTLLHLIHAIVQWRKAEKVFLDTDIDELTPTSLNRMARRIDKNEKKMKKIIVWLKKIPEERWVRFLKALDIGLSVVRFTVPHGRKDANARATRIQTAFRQYQQAKKKKELARTVSNMIRYAPPGGNMGTIKTFPGGNHYRAAEKRFMHLTGR